jgi:hypothetical protein
MGNVPVRSYCRVVTEALDGKSVVKDDDLIKVYNFDSVPGFRHTLLWAGRSTLTWGNSQVLRSERNRSCRKAATRNGAGRAVDRSCHTVVQFRTVDLGGAAPQRMRLKAASSDWVSGQFTPSGRRTLFSRAGPTSWQS